MSKISAANWMVRTSRAYWKRFAALATGFIHKYRDDFFIRTEINIIALQIAYAVLMLALMVAAIIVLYHDILSGMVTAIALALTSSTPTISPSDIMFELEAARTREIIGVATLILILTAVFGYLVARFALLPARTALAAQKQFIGNIAHELRTPLSIIKTNTEVWLLAGNVSEASRKVHMSNLEELDRISDIINNLLSLNVLVRPEHIPFKRVDVREIVHRVVEKLELKIRKKSLRIRIHADKEHFTWGNPSAIEQIVMNIMKNAVHHTDKGEISVTIGPDALDMLEISIADTGAGIKREDLYRIFEPFYRGDRARTRNGGAGSGLGLTIVSELVKLHHGKVGIRSTPGKGTTVKVTLPMKEKRTREKDRVPQLQDEVDADFSNLT
ncbi:MAG: sensor histidine kinase [Minisyncoccota bacterium]